MLCSPCRIDFLFRIVIGMLLALLTALLSCGKKDLASAGEKKRIRTMEANGYLVPQDSMAEPEVIPVDESKLKKILAGKPEVTLINTNVHPAGNPSAVKAKPARICVPGKDGFGLPGKARALSRPVRAGIPEKIMLKDAFIKDQNPHNFSIYGKLQGLTNSIIRSLLQDKDGNIWFGTSGGGLSKFDGNSITNYTSKEGLCNDKIRSILQDRQGNLWFGTHENGVSKFDGNDFINFSVREGLPGTTINAIIQDRKDNIWFGTSAGACKYDGKNFTTFTTKEGLSDNYILSVCEDRNGNIWFGTEGSGVCRYDGNAFTHFTANEGLPDNIVMSILEDRSGNIWFGTYGGGVCKYDGYNFSRFSRAEGLPGDEVESMLEDRQGNIWFGINNGGVVRYDGHSFFQFTSSEGLSDNTVLSILEDNAGNMWFGTYGGGVSKYAGQIFTHFTEREGLSNKQIFSCMEDSRGNLWFGTWGFGVNKFDGRSMAHYSIAQGLSGDQVFSMLEDRKGNIWFATWGGGVCRYDGKYFTHFTRNDGLANNIVLSILEDKKGNLWFGTYGGGISRYDGFGFTNYTEKQGLANNLVFGILEDRNGNIWIGTERGGISKFTPGGKLNPGKGQFINFSVDQGLSSHTVYSILEDQLGNIWIGTEDAVCMYDGSRFTIIGENEGLSNNDVMSLLMDRQKNIYLGTRKGLNRIPAERLPVFIEKIKKGSLSDDDVFFQQSGHEEGFFGMGVNRGQTMLEDRRGTLWIATNDRLTAFHPKGMRKDTLSPTIKITDIQLFNEQIAWPLLQGVKDSTLYLKNGMQVEGFEFGEVSSWYGIPENLSLAWNSNYLTFHFTGITMNQPKRVKYQYMLKGMDENWSGITLRREATYGNIPPGNYTFLVKAMNNGGVWSKPVEYHFTVRPPWWRTWWAYSCFGILLMVSGMSFIRYRERSLRERQIELEEKVEEAGSIIRKQKEEEKKNILRMEEEKARAKDAFLADMSHEIRTPLNAVLGFHELLKNTSLDQEQKNHVDIIGNALRNLNVIINDILDISKLESGKLELEKRPFSIGNLVHQVSQMHMARAKAKNLELLVHLDDGIPEFVSGDETRLSQILINLLSNALKFTSRGRVEISVKELNRAAGQTELKFSVSDTGIGIDPGKLDKIFERFTQAEESTTRKYGGTGLGLNIVKSLVEMHGGKIQVQSTPGEGSEFNFTVSYAIAATPASASDNPSEPRQNSAVLQGIKVLLVEDNEYNQILARTWLERNGAIIETASDGLKGLEALEKNTIDVVLMDIEMPGMNGLEATEKIRQQLMLDIPIFGCSAHALESEKIRCLEAGMTGYISKPYTEQDLISAILGSSQPEA